MIGSVRKIFAGLLVGVVMLPSCATVGKSHRQNMAGKTVPGHCYAVYADEDVKIDGTGDEAFWARAEWTNMDQCYLGSIEDSNDYSGRFKAAWKGSQIFIFAEITDNVVTNFMNAGFEDYWQGDCVEVFIDEDRSGGEHQFNHNAFACHVLYSGEVIDVDTDEQAKLFPDIIKHSIVKNGNTYMWEMAITVYSDEYNHNAKSNETARVELNEGKKLGFTLAYGDNDGDGRHAFYGNTPDQGDTGYMNADKFGVLELIK